MSREMRTAAIEASICRELSSMQEILGHHADADAFLALQRWTRSTLGNIGNLMASGRIDPTAAERKKGGSMNASPRRRPFRLGVLPTAGNPLHWGHLLAGLAAIERFQLDKVVYLVAGEDPRKPGLAPEDIRHRIAKDVLRLFHPLLEYSPLARGTTEPGELNVFQFFAVHKAWPLHVFYLAGSDHFHRFTSLEGRPDTIQRLETGIRGRIAGFNPRTHRLSAVFLDRGDRCGPVETFLDVRWIDGLPVRASSTTIRGALSGQEPLCELVALPFTAYCAICAQGTYRMQQEDKGRPLSECDFFRAVSDADNHQAHV
jgi:nicotinic acid mononucleotide adenylyltransferase